VGVPAAHFSIYASSADGIGWLQIDDAALYLDSVTDITRTLCYDPQTPLPPEATPELDPR